MSKRTKEYHFKPIECPSGQGHIALTIRPPGTWFNSPDYVCFVGGCGVGHKRTLIEAREHLFVQAKRIVAERERTTERVLWHWRAEVAKLVNKGLERV